jgi:multisubunit Na+/H+ antiporter MnhE subunit
MSGPVRVTIVLAFGAIVSAVTILLFWLLWPSVRAPIHVALGVATASLAGRLLEDRLAARPRRVRLAVGTGALAFVATWAASLWVLG